MGSRRERWERGRSRRTKEGRKGRITSKARVDGRWGRRQREGGGGGREMKERKEKRTGRERCQRSSKGWQNDKREGGDGNIKGRLN